MTEIYLIELFAGIFFNKRISELCISYLKYSYLSVEEFKMIWKSIRTYHSIHNTIPTIGYIAQKLDDGSDIGNKINEILGKISEAKVDEQGVTDAFEIHIKERESMEFYDKFCEAINSNNQNKAVSLMSEYAEKINNITIKSISTDKVFGGFKARMLDNRIEYATKGEIEKIPTGIDPFDYVTEGGIERGDTACMMMRSGVGKSKFLKEIGVNASIMGYPVLHFSAEGTKKECLHGYDVTWTACMMSDIKRGSINPDRYENLSKFIKEITVRKKSEIYVHAFEQFDSATVPDLRAIVRDVMRHHPIALILVDYLELISPADGIIYNPKDERHRRLAIAEKFKNLAIENNTGLWTATQANDINPKLLNDPTFVMTRHNTSECKSLSNPFSYFITGNQTDDEYDDGMMRLYYDKMRHYKRGQLYTIYQDYDNGRFYDRKKSRQYLDEIGDMDIYYKGE